MEPPALNPSRPTVHAVTPRSRELLDRIGVVGKRIIVTGAAQGIGRTIAQTFAAEGAVVAAVDREATLLHALRAEPKAHGVPAVTVPAELGTAAGAVDAVDAAADALGGLDAIVNNAGGSASTPANPEDVTGEDLDRVLAWNVTSTFFCCQAALPWLRRNGAGSIVNMGAISGRAGTELLPAQYSAAKAGVIGMSRNLARHVGPEGIRVNVVAPGFIESGPRVEAIWNARDPASVLGLIPLRRRGTTGEVTDAVRFLASDGASYVTGAVIDVNGGFFCL